MNSMQLQIISRCSDPTPPLSFVQQRFWLLNQLSCGSPVYTIPLAYRVQGMLHIEALEQSLKEIIRRHEVLRTTFGTMNGQPVQVVGSLHNMNLSVVDIRGIQDSEKESRTQMLVNELIQMPFDLTHGPLLYTRLIRLYEEESLLILNIHRIISDERSIDVFMRELGELYDAFTNGKSSPLPELPVQYMDFAVWERQRLKGEILENLLTYWKGRLSGSLPLLNVPSDRPRPAIQTHHGAKQSLEIPKKLTEALVSLSQRKGLSLFTTLLSAFHILLHRYTGQNDIIVGSPVPNRDMAEVKNLIGCFDNMLILCADLSCDPTCDELLARVHKVTLEAYEHQYMPFDKLVEELQPEKNLSHNPLFQVALAFHDAPIPVPRFSGLTVNPIMLDSKTSQFDLFLNLWEAAGQGLVGWCEYNTDIFDSQTITRMTRHFQKLLEGIASEPSQKISTLPLLGEEEERQLLVEWNNTRAPYPHDTYIHRLFEAQVENTPDAVAVEFEDQHMTYRELDCRANQLAHHLIALGVGTEVLVGICMERCPDMVVGILGILKAGGAYVPLDPTYPKQRLALMLEDVQASVLLTQSRLVENLPNHSGHVICLDTQWDTISGECDKRPDIDIDPKRLAYVIFTSGSTGKPKGILLQHQGLCNLIHASNRLFNVRPDSRVLQFASPSFDVAVWETFMALVAGATLCLGSRDTQYSLIQLPKMLRERSITMALLSPSLLSVLPADDLHALETIIAVGERCTTENVKRWSPGRSFFNGYGPAEGTVTVSAYLTSFKETYFQGPPIGRPIDNIRLYVLDRYLQPVPVGVAGELFIGGVGVGRGYLNQPGLTAESFVPDQFSSEPGSRLYKSGDLARYLPDGNLEFLGRVDHQVKIRGFRIEPGEIEALLRKNSSVQEATVMVREDVPGEKRLIAYVVPKEEWHEAFSSSSHESPGALEENLRHFLQKRLPYYMIPSAFVVLKAFPLTPNGKLDRNALPSPDTFRKYIDAGFAPPRSFTEGLLASIWSEIMGLGKVGIHDNFIELGGHSLIATQIALRVYDVLQMELPVNSLFEFPTIAELAKLVDMSLQKKRGKEAPPLKSAARGQNLPLSFFQQQLWFFCEMYPDQPVYNEPCTIRMVGNIDVAVLEQSLTEIIRRHESLRTTFNMVDGTPTQVIHPTSPFKLKTVDLRHLSDDIREAEALRMATEELKLPFNLTTGPLFRVTLVQLSDTDNRLFMSLHHLINDGVSMTGIFLPELETIYTAFSSGRSSPLTDPTLQYADFAMWQRQWQDEEFLSPHLAYWKEKLSDLPMLQLPTDHPRSAKASFQGARQCLAFSKSLTEKLKALSRQEEVTLFMTLIAAFKVLLYRYSGQEDIVIGTVTAGRDRPEVEGIIGYFLNLLVLRTDLSASPSFKQLLKRVRASSLEAYTHQYLPFDRLVAGLKPARQAGQIPIIQVMFVLEPPMREHKLEWDMSYLDFHSGTSKFDLTFELDEREGGIIGRVEYSTDLFDHATITRMIGHFKTLLEGIVANPSQQISELPLLTEEENRQLLWNWNGTQTTYSEDRCVHELFEARAEETPDALAVKFEDQYVTYEELNRRANQLAHHLKTLGVGPEVVVGICMDRSPDIVAGLLGILKAGGAYLPLDPEYPKERHAFMLSQSQVRILLTQEHLARDMHGYGVHVICLDTMEEPLKALNNPVRRATSENLAYVIYTSGSTGKPKGVGIRHAGLSNFVAWHRHVYNVAHEDRVSQIASLSFDASVLEIWPPLAAGASIFIPDKEIRNTPARFMEWLSEEAITICFLPTPLAEAFLKEEWPEHMCLRFLLTGGDKLCHRHSVCHSFRFMNQYGPTEGTVVATYAQVEVGTQSTPPHIGRPIWNTQIYILDSQLNPVPVGIPGELHIGGACLARGYDNSPELTAEKFIPSPFSTVPGTRIYKTGDLARYLPDGNIEFIGRIDHQVKIHGLRIEPGEIEVTLGQHPGVRENVVLAREDQPGERRIIAYIVPGRVLTVNELRIFLKHKLPDYMIPSAFVFLDALPLTTNGKIARHALPPPDVTSFGLEEKFVAPSTDVEKALAGIWREVLHVERIGIHDGFFELGGDSLLAVQIISRVNDVFHVKLSMTQFFEAMTIARLALTVAKQQGRHGDSRIKLLDIIKQGKEEELLKNIDRFSQEEVDFLLGKMLRENEEGSKT